ncbi:hypothetical protein D6764_00925 [Candidatus Woesearchaeota archaeon]|nr:MAG: hypothetical protein D6764_00925 [Candidatus Woesearchaeota archaeon]
MTLRNEQKSDFDRMKRRALLKKDKSRAGSIDEPIRELINFINSLDDYYTTSSCSGRILIIAPSGKKKDSQWLLVKHAPVSAGEVRDALSSLPDSGTVWFRVESFIVHVGCRNLDAADHLP